MSVSDHISPETLDVIAFLFIVSPYFAYTTGYIGVEDVVAGYLFLTTYFVWSLNDKANNE